ncbi:MAG: exodeoxyribonuclease VII large subunit [Candidatus Thiodiazotropha lotti]|uniref:exodeoxyribonuclease VII large subunit n=1 Tax=Candidatus Thiodiazotropha endoloripes TaxID=1818881 RepID=UPI00083D87CB|nr:exodeoxyribonuclease VII large subunit [Candidatus Thiodiazotropha endoloripes]MCG7904136.1 exodeoxyribonuclease VII large subunit [Candidatus Thiodiazotropha weberae]MCG7993652.1 exodeoxyribonuclease VII large subunit [Candidatus Thiodiazotropha lotti]MCG8001194.1 exodeoxyribonuclease VII large subunit [Candidatus Thiodiazotropha lotti]MCW4185316.1 exodeoxyribonuclease VII large subunit [Candidatus Thiodiazotropha weberae]MCW4192968.1 exodeoxyribonuclease VII large subunit [Candidatus Thio
MNQQSPANNGTREIFSVSRLVRETRAVLEASFPLLWVSGEISNLAQPASGHIYFSLKDEAAQVRCAMFRMKRQRLRFRPENGQQVLIRAKVSLYEARGEFQLIAEHMEPAGEGALRIAFEQLKQKLATEGLFDSEQKKPIPVPPKQLGLITSPTGAAVRDLLSVLKRRFPALPVIIYPVQVQGEDAARQIVQMLKLAEQRQECDLLILSRGGGSLEDLQAFNEEQVARAIHEVSIPVVTGIGHEIDFTIADFVADRRAATPSAAAELVTPDQLEWQQRLHAVTRRLKQNQQQRLQQLQQHFSALLKRLQIQHPKRRLQQQAQRLDELSDRLSRQFHVNLLQKHQRVDRLHTRLARQTPEQRLKRLVQQTTSLEQRLHRAVTQRLNREQTRFTQLGRDLHNLSPLNTLGRGYSIVSSPTTDAIITDASDVELGDELQARLHKGSLICQVVKKNL